MLDGYERPDPRQRLSNPVWHIHSGRPPKIDMPISFQMLLTLVSSSNAENAETLWGFIGRYRPGVTPQTHPELNAQVEYAIHYFRDFVQPEKKFRHPTDSERAALTDLRDALAQLEAKINEAEAKRELIIAKQHSAQTQEAITGAMRKACEKHGVEISIESPVAQVQVDNGRAVGVRLESGEEVIGKAVVANVGPRLLYDKLVAPGDLTEEFRRRVRGFKVGSGTFRMNVALSELPRFTCLPEPGEHHQSGIIIAPTLDYMDQAYLDAKQFGMSKRPIVEMLIPSTVDDSLAPPGQHVASLFCQQFAPTLPDGRSWDDAREEAADVIIETVEAQAPGFRASVIARQIHSPLDLERKFGLTGGDIMHGNMSLDQLWSARPILGNGAYRGPLKGLYMCGAGTHPGGGVTGAPGHNAAREILSDNLFLGRFRHLP